jgi:Trk-type K+ transport system membrane component
MIDGDPANNVTLPAGYKVVDAFFQVVSTRTAGFNVLDLSNLS